MLVSVTGARRQGERHALLLEALKRAGLTESKAAAATEASVAAALSVQRVVEACEILGPSATKTEPNTTASCCRCCTNCRGNSPPPFRGQFDFVLKDISADVFLICPSRVENVAV